MRASQQDAAAITGFAVGRHRAAVSHAGEGGAGGVHQAMTGFALHVRNEAETATFFSILRFIQSFVSWAFLHQISVPQSPEDAIGDASFHC